MGEPTKRGADDGGGADAVAERAGAWDRFYAHCFRIINQCPFVRRLSTTDREDCIQEVMFAVVRKLGAEPPPGDGELTGWIRVVSRNTAVTMARRRARAHEVGFDDGAGAGLLDRPQGPTGVEGVSEGDSLSLLWEALSALDEQTTMSSYVIFLSADD